MNAMCLIFGHKIRPITLKGEDGQYHVYRICVRERLKSAKEAMAS